MSYPVLLEKEAINAQFLTVLKPRRRATGFTVFSGAVYVADFDYGQVVQVLADGVALTQGSSSALSANQFFFDETLNKLYVRLTGADPDSVFCVATYEIYTATSDAHWHRVPNDDTTRVVYFDPVIKNSPPLKSTSGENLYGFFPVQTGTITLNNAEHWLEKHISDSSFNKAPIQVYHWLGELEIANIELVYNGLCSDVTYNSEVVSISTFDRIDLLAAEFRNPTGSNFFALGDFPSLDPQSVLRPIRQVYGRVDDFVPVNIDYPADPQNPTTSENREWVVQAGQVGLGDQVKTVAASPASTATRTYLTSVTGLAVGDSVWLDRAVGTDEYKLITVVGANYIEHTALTGGAMASGDFVRRSFVGSVTIMQDGVKYTALYKRDYDIDTFAGGTSGFTFETTLEANLSLPLTLRNTDPVFCRVYGRVNDLTLGGPAFGSNHATTGNLATVAQVLLDLLKRILLITDAELNQASFAAALASITGPIGMAIPETATGSFPKIKDLMTQLLRTGLIRLFIDADSKWALSLVAPTVSNDDAIDSEEILDGSFSYKFGYKDILSDVIVRYNKRETSVNQNGEEAFDQVNAESSQAKFVHLVSKSETFDALFILEADAQELCDRISFASGEREGQLTLDCKNRFFQTVIGDTIDSTRPYIPGTAFDPDVSATQRGVVTAVERSLKRVKLTLSDNKGIDDNAGSW